MKNAVCIFFCFSFLFAGRISSAETIHDVAIMRHFDEEQGLSTKTVYTVIQDKLGFIWFATDAGVFRYDGTSFRHFTVDDGLADNEILKMYEDKKGKIWFLSYNGYLSYWYNGRMYNPTNTPYLKKAYIGASFVSVYEDHRNRLWFGCLKTGFICIDDTSVKAIITANDRKERVTAYVTEDDSGGMWYFYEYSMVNFETGKKIKILAEVISACKDINGSGLIYNSPVGLIKIHNLNFDLFADTSHLPYFQKIVNITMDSSNLWICSLGEGCIQYKNGKFFKRHLDKSSVTSALEDREGNYWFTTMNDGIYVVYNSSRAVRNYNLKSGLSESKIFSIATDPDGGVWLGYYNGLIDYIRGNEKTTYALRGSKDPEYLRTMQILALNDTVWCATDAGIFYITKGKVTKVPYESSRDKTIQYASKHISHDRNNQVYSAFSLNFLRVMKVDDGYYAKTLLDSVTRTFSSVALSSGAFVVSTLSGLIKYTPGEPALIIKTDTDFSHMRILDMKADANDVIFLATNTKGVFILKGNKVIQQLSTADKLSDNNCRRIHLGHGDLYVCTSMGLNIFRKVNDRWIHMNTISTKNGLLSNSINDVDDDDSLIYIGTDKGFSIVRKDFEKFSTVQRDVVITEIVTDKSHSVSDNTYTLQSDISRLIIRYSYPVFNLNNRIRVRYRLIKENSPGSWVNSGNNEVEFSSLTPGNYVFQIMPVIDEEHFGRVKSLNINVPPKWYQTIPARLIFSFVILFLIIYISRRRIKMQYERNLEKLRQQSIIEAERNRIATDMHDDIGADLTQISIWSNVLKSTDAGNKDVVSRINNLSNEVLSKMDQIIWALNSIHNKTNDLLSYLHEYSSEYLEASNIDVMFNVGERIPEMPLSMSQRRNVFLVIKELLHNTVKHSGATCVDISITFNENFLVIHYSDNGSGFETSEAKNGLGFTTMRKRMSEIQSSIVFKNNERQGMYAVLNISMVKKNFVE